MITGIFYWILALAVEDKFANASASRFSVSSNSNESRNYSAFALI
jgi:hypothetical protein